MVDSDALSLANLLIDLDVIKISQDQPFFYTSGWASPIYLDPQALLSDVAARKKVMGITRDMLAPIIHAQGITAIVGTESSGVAYAAWMAQSFELPLLFLRKKPVGWGMKAQIEGLFNAGQRVLLVDDVTTDGKSKVDACLALRRSGLIMHDAFVLIDFGIYPYTDAMLKDNELNMNSLMNWPTLLEALRQRDALPSAKMASLESFTQDPAKWSMRHGGIGQWTP